MDQPGQGLKYREKLDATDCLDPTQWHNLI